MIYEHDPGVSGLLKAKAAKLIKALLYIYPHLYFTLYHLRT